MLFRFLAASAIGAALSGCAYVSAVPVTADSQINGIRIYECKPLIKIVGTTVDVIWITNPDRQTALNFGTFLAKQKLKANFTNGCLTSIDSDQDTTDVAVALIKMVKGVAEKAGSFSQAFSTSSPDQTGVVIQLYDPVFDGTGNLVHLRPLIHHRDFQRLPKSAAVALGSGAQTGAGNGPAPPGPAPGTPPKVDSQ